MKSLVLGCLALFFALQSEAQKECSHSQYMQQELEHDPHLAANLRRYELANTDASRTYGTQAEVLPSVITIPVVVHVLYNQAGQNISEEKIKEQIQALNRDFSGENTDMSKVPSYFTSLIGKAGIRFELAKVDPAGKATNGIVRRQTGIQNFTTDDRAKFSGKGGSDAWDSKRYLNIWVCNLLVLGYASSPGSPAEKDGVVISTNVFGLGSGRFGMGRTATHEVGHWLGLKHIWGDGYCGDDGVDDTPKQQAANRGCITGVKLSCGNTTTGDMYMNFMDMVDDPCMVMFSAGQVSRMRSQFLSAGARNSLLTSNGLTAAPVVAPNPVQNPVVTTAATPARVEAYPSPATSQLFVRFSEEINIAGKHVSIYNQMGQRVTTIIAANNNVQVNVQGWAKGMYVARLEEDVTLMVRFMKM
jgi:hypothetical protein